VDWITPAGADELAEAVRARADDGAPPVTGAAGPPDGLPEGARPPDAVLSTAALSGVLEHRPRDLTVTVGAGTRVDDLLGRLEEAGGWLPFGGLSRELSVGGAVACALPGPWDAGHGDLRRQLLACELVAWSGRRLRWGRGVMKNVAGYGMTRAVAGSFGRLGVVHRATFRLWPAPEERRSARLRPPGGGDGLEAAGRIARSGFDAEVRPDAVVWRGAPEAEAGAGGLEVRFVGTADSVELRLGRLRSWAAEAGLEVDVAPAAGPTGDGDGPAGPGDDAGEPAGPFGRRRSGAASAAWAAAGRRGFERAARTARDALGGALLGLEGYPLSGDLRCAWAAGHERGSGDGPPGGGSPAPGGGDRPPPAARLLEALGGVPVRIERGRRAELEAAERRRDEGVRRLELRVVDALGGRPRRWLSGYL
jgi:FAD/FMN-containing dehydrogenase